MVLVRKVSTFAAASLLAGGSVAADGHSAGLGMFAVAPGFSLGGSLAFYNLADVLGVDGSLYGWNDKQDDGRTRYEVGASLGLNAELLHNLYPSLAATVTGANTKGFVFRRQQERCPTHHGVTHCPLIRETETDHEATRWGVEAKVTYVVFDGWLGLTAGYRLTFADPLEHRGLLGVSAIIRPRSLVE